MLEQAFEALKVYDWGTDPKVLQPINAAIIESHGNEDARQELESRLTAILASDTPRDAKDFVCRKLMLIGTETSVPALAKLLPSQDESHMARYALERMPCDAAGDALRAALGNVEPAVQVGVISSLGARGDEKSVAQIGELVSSDDAAVATAAARALGAIGTADAAKALAENQASSDQAKMAATDASFACAESLLAHGKKAEAVAIYKAYIGSDQPKHIRTAATRGMLAGAK